MARLYWQISVTADMGYHRLMAELRRLYPQFGPDLLVRVSAGPDGSLVGRYILPDNARALLEARLSPTSLASFFNSIRFITTVQVAEDQALDAIAHNSVPEERPPDMGNDGYSKALLAIKADIAHRNHPDALANLPTVRVAHIDTGLSDHPCFLDAGGNTWLQYDEGRDFVDNLGPPRDPWPDELPYSGFPGHGVRTASVLCGLHRAGGDTIFTGVAPGVPTVPYRLFNTTIIDTIFGQTRLDEALDHALAKDCHVISLSMGDPVNPRPQVKRSVDRLYEAGVIFVCAAGNVIPTVVWPAAFPNTIAAGGSRVEDDGPWAGGSEGPQVDISAPADKVSRANWQGAGGLKQAVYGSGDGTSYATAQVAGAAALWLAKHGVAALQARYPGWQIVEAFRSVLKGTARPGRNWNKRKNGAGILDVAALLAAPLPDAATLTKR